MNSAEEIVDRILHDLQGRKGLGNEWDEIDPEIQQEIREEWIQLVKPPPVEMGPPDTPDPRGPHP